MQITPTPPQSAHSMPTQNIGLPDIENLRSSIMELDTDGDGQISDGEFAIYRSQKQASGQFIPQNGPMNEKMQQTMFEALLMRDG